MSEANASLLSSIDRLVGNGIEAAVRAKHAWRLRRLGWPRALAPPDDGGVWAGGDPPPREGCELERGGDARSIGQLLAEAAERVDVRALVWAGATVPLFHLKQVAVREAV